MASIIDKVKNDLLEAINASQRKTSAYDTEAEIVRVDGNTAWVHIAGGVAETPVAMTINAQKGDKVQVRVANDGAWLMGNATAPPTDDKKANEADKKAAEAKYIAVDAAEAAVKADAAAQDAVESAETASAAAQQAQEDAEDAQTSATQAQASAENASEYAARALGNLSTVQNITETLNWITQHGTMTLTTDTALDPTHVYFVVDAQGDYVVGTTHYSVVTEPNVADIATYYELSIDESLNNYVATHLAVDSEGLWILPDSGGNKVLIATGNGSTYTTAGTYVISGSSVLAEFGANGSQIGINGQSRLELDYHSMQAVDKEGDYYFYVSDLRNADGFAEMSETMSSVYSSSTTITCYTTLIAYDWENEMEVYADGVLLTPVTGYTYDPTPNMREISIYRSEYPDVTRDSTIVVNYKTIDQQAKAYTIGLRDDTDTTGVMSTAMGLNTVASGYCSLAWGKGSKAFGKYSCALGERCKAWKMGSYAEGCATEAGYTAHAEGVNTRATGMYSHAQGSQSKATGQCAHAEGEYTQATGPRAHAEGCHTLASDADSHAGGWYSEASGDSAFAHGSYANAQGDQASAFGRYTLASSSNQFVIGKYNVEDTSSTYAFIIGKGTNTSGRSNAMQVDWNGKTTIASTLVQNSDRRLKDHIDYLDEDAVDFIRQLKPAHYRKDDADHVGFYAQDVESADKWNCMVGEMNGFKTLGYTELIAPLVAYCQSLEKRIEELEGK